MRRILPIYFLSFLTLIASPVAYSAVSSQTDIQSFPQPPQARKIPELLEKHNHTRTDNYFWLKDKSNPETIEYIKAENAYAETILAPTKSLQTTILNELKGRIKEDSTTLPTFKKGYYYYERQEAGKQYPIICRKRSLIDKSEEILLDQNLEAKGKAAFVFMGYWVNTANNLMAYMSNDTGSFAEFTIRFRNLTTGQNLNDVIPLATSFIWANDGENYFYIVPDSVTLRPNKIYRSRLGSPKEVKLVFEETDEQFNLDLEEGRTGRFAFLISQSYDSTEYQLIDLNNPNSPLQIFLPRSQNFQYYLLDHENFFVLRFREGTKGNFRLMQLPLSDYQNRSHWTELVPYDSTENIERMSVFKNHVVYSIRQNGLIQIRVLNLLTKKQSQIPFSEPIYHVTPDTNPNYDSIQFRYQYSSLNHPLTTYEYDLNTQDRQLLKQQEIPSGFNPGDYLVKRLWATSHDGTQVPISLIYKKDLALNGSNPTLLEGYGSYGYSYPTSFNSSIFSLVDRGYIYAIAHVRGGSELGEQWYEQGKLLNKKNTFYDFIASAEKLIADHYTSPTRLAMMGGSAGGLLVGAVLNMRPDLFRVAIAEVPFVDTLTTMLDSTLPLTTQEYQQWGNPNELLAYNYILSYSPYDNVRAQNYPSILITGGMADSQVLFHEPTKWAAKLREYKTDSHQLLLMINMDSGHGGATGRFAQLEEIARMFSFLITEVEK